MVSLKNASFDLYFEEKNTHKSIFVFLFIITTHRVFWDSGIIQLLTADLLYETLS
jgi:hypothetical protein